MPRSDSITRERRVNPPASTCARPPRPRRCRSGSERRRSRSPTRPRTPRRGRSRPSPRPVTPRIRPPFVTSRSPCSAVPAWKTRAPAASARSRPVIGVPCPRAGVSGRSDDDGDRGAGLVRECDARQLADCGRGERLGEVAIEQREHRLRLRVAEAAVELEDARPVLRQHEPGVEETDEGAAASGELLEHRTVDRVDELTDLGLAEPGHRRVRAHATGVRPGVGVVRALEVLGGDERHRLAAVAEREQRHLRPSRSSSTTTPRPSLPTARNADSTSACDRQT